MYSFEARSEYGHKIGDGEAQSRRLGIHHGLLFEEVSKFTNDFYDIRALILALFLFYLRSMFEQSENGIREENLFYYRKGVDIMTPEEIVYQELLKKIERVRCEIRALERQKAFLMKNYNHAHYVDEKLNIA